MKIKLDPGAKMPTRAHTFDAGLDLYAPEDCIVPAAKVTNALEPWEDELVPVVEVGSLTIDTGVHMEIPECFCGFIKSKSGLNVKHGLTAEGVIDSKYTGSIAVKLYNHTPDAYHIKAGEKIAQLVILPCLLPSLELVDSLDDTERGTGGFGSTGKF